MFHTVNVLAIDDDPVLRRLYRRVLGAMTFEVEVVDSLSESMSLVDWADIAILDLKLQNGHGQALLQHWIDQRKGPILVVSGNITPEIENELLAGRAWNVLPKPVSNDVLRAVMQRYGEYVLFSKEFAKMRKAIDDLQTKVIPALREQIDEAKKITDTWKTRFFIALIVAASAGAGVGFGIDTLLGLG